MFKSGQSQFRGQDVTQIKKLWTSENPEVRAPFKEMIKVFSLCDDTYYIYVDALSKLRYVDNRVKNLIKQK